jgi:hypothetical protein
MRIASLLFSLAAAPVALGAQTNPNQVPTDPSPWPQHSLDRPAPSVVTPAPAVLIAPPSDAQILFNGRTLSAWHKADTTAPAGWRVANGFVETVPNSGGIVTNDSFGDVQLHVEWSSPLPAVGEGQHRGNSGVFLMEQYEVQVLDSYNSKTYADGQAGALYGQFPPLVNPIRPPGQWNSYDIIFHRPRFAPDGLVEKPAQVTVLFNGVVVQNEQVLIGPTSHGERSAYLAHPDRLPIALQDHGSKVRLRNIWVRRLE